MISAKQFSSLYELMDRFPTELSCHEYIASQRWADGIICPHPDCTGTNAYAFADGIRYKCKCCKRKFNVKTGSFLEGSHLPLRKWFMAIYLVMHKKGISSHQLSRDANVTQKTAWFMLQRIRFVFEHDPARNTKLEGVILLDETFVGGKNKNRHRDKKVSQSQRRSFKDKTPVMGMLEQQETIIISRPHKIRPELTVNEKQIVKPSLLVCNVVPNTSIAAIGPSLYRQIKLRATVVSDEWQAYKSLYRRYEHKVVDHVRKQYATSDGYSTNALEGAWSIFKRSIIGIYHYVTPKHLNKYVQEFVFRYNYRNFGVQQQMNGVFSNMNHRLRYRDLIHQHHGYKKGTHHS